MSKHRPQADPSDFEKGPRGWWFYRTRHPSRYVIQAGYFDAVYGVGVGDRIETICLGDEAPAYLSLAVEAIGREHGAKVKTCVLRTYEKGARQ
jgi:hypothetical protein